MKTGTKIGLIGGGVLLFFGLIVIGGVVAFSLYSLSSGADRARVLYKKRTAETVGTITTAAIGTARSYNYTYKYVVNGVSYTGTDDGVRSPGDTSFRNRVGKQGHVCYDPSDPSSAGFYLYEYFPAEQKEGNPFCAKPAK
jgi:hypothetical protein